MKQWDREQILQREAYNNGEENGIKTINQLNDILISEGRFDDLSKSVKDPVFQKQLIIELVDKDYAL